MSSNKELKSLVNLNHLSFFTNKELQLYGDAVFRLIKEQAALVQRITSIYDKLVSTKKAEELIDQCNRREPMSKAVGKYSISINVDGTTYVLDRHVLKRLREALAKNIGYARKVSKIRAAKIQRLSTLSASNAYYNLAPGSIFNSLINTFNTTGFPYTNTFAASKYGKWLIENKLVLISNQTYTLAYPSAQQMANFLRMMNNRVNHGSIYAKNEKIDNKKLMELRTCFYLIAALGLGGGENVQRVQQLNPDTQLKTVINKLYFLYMSSFPTENRVKRITGNTPFSGNPALAAELERGINPVTRIGAIFKENATKANINAQKAPKGKAAQLDPNFARIFIIEKGKPDEINFSVVSSLANNSFERAFLTDYTFSLYISVTKNLSELKESKRR